MFVIQIHVFMEPAQDTLQVLVVHVNLDGLEKHVIL